MIHASPAGLSVGPYGNSHAGKSSPVVQLATRNGRVGTVARHYRKLLDRYTAETGADSGFVQFQEHDFSFRGMSGPEDAALSGAAHPTSVVGTDTVAAIDLLEDYYGGSAGAELLGGSVPAAEHSVMCVWTPEAEIETFLRLVTRLYPKGIVSIVSHTWDFWRVVTEYASELKDEILARDCTVVFRPDSGDPVKIICGDPDAPVDSPDTRERWNACGTCSAALSRRKSIARSTRTSG